MCANMSTLSGLTCGIRSYPLGSPCSCTAKYDCVHNDDGTPACPHLHEVLSHALFSCPRTCRRGRLLRSEISGCQVCGLHPIRDRQVRSKNLMCNRWRQRNLLSAKRLVSHAMQLYRTTVSRPKYLRVRQSRLQPGSAHAIMHAVLRFGKGFTRSSRLKPLGGS